jgi:hypothetical protein
MIKGMLMCPSTALSVFSSRQIASTNILFYLRTTPLAHYCILHIRAAKTLALEPSKCACCESSIYRST